MKIYLTPGFHSDVIWLEDQRDYAVSLLGNVRQNLEISRIDPDYGVFLHELTYLRPYLDAYPEERDYIRQLIKEGRIGTGGSHSQPTETLISGEGLIRNILYGRLFSEKFLNDSPSIYMPWDVFGHCSQLAQILTKSRFTGCIWSKDIRGVHPIFWHEALDGSKLLFRRVMYGFWPPLPEKECLKHLEKQAKELTSYGLHSDLKLDCADFKPPTAWMAGRCRELKEKDCPVIVSGTAHEQFFNEVHSQVKEDGLALPVSTRDYEWYHQGTGLTRIEFKIANRIGENILSDAEKFATIASYLGAKYPDKAIDKAWRQILFNQHHDGITGPCCDRAYLDLMLGFREALELASSVLDNSLIYLGQFISTGNKRDRIPIAVFNSLNWERTDIAKVDVNFPLPVSGFRIEDSQGKVVPCQIENIKDKNGKIVSCKVNFVGSDVPSLGYKVYYIIPEKGNISSPIIEKGNFIENEFFRIEADEKLGGGIRIYDKVAQKDVLSGIGNEIVILGEDPNRKEPPWEVWTTGKKTFSRNEKAKVEVLRGSVCLKLIIRAKGANYSRYQEIILYHGMRRIDFMTSLQDYKGKDEIFTVTFPVQVEGGEPVFEDRFGCIVKNKSKGYLDFRTHVWNNFSDCGLGRAYQWVDLSNSGQLIFKEGDRIKSSWAWGKIGLIVSRDQNLIKSAELLQEALIKNGITSTIFFDDCDRERRKKLPFEDNTFPQKDLNEDLKWGTSFRIVLDSGNKNRYCTRLLKSIPTKSKETILSRLKNEGLAISFLLDKDIPSGWSDLPTLLVMCSDTEKLRSKIEDFCQELKTNGNITLPGDSDLTDIHQEVEDYGVALLNHGNVLNSVEKDGSLVLFLMHTSSWGITKWGKDRLNFFLVPEHKTHQFFYSLYPHKGSWRDAKTFKAGYEVNHPLKTIVLKPQDGVLPSEMSFLKTNADNFIITAMKPGANPAASLEAKDVNINSHGIILRGYEASGKETTVKVDFFQPLNNVLATNLLEEPQHELTHENNSYTFSSGPFSIETQKVLPANFEKPGTNQDLGIDKEPVQPVYSKYWQHNAGEAPIGNSPVAISLSGEFKTGIHIMQGGVSVNTIKLGISNNYIDKEISGIAKLHTSHGWKTVPESIDYCIKPGSQLIKDILIAFVSDEREDLDYKPKVDITPRVKKGMVRAEIEEDGQRYYDVMATGEYNLNWKLMRTDDKIEVEIENPNDDLIYGQIFLSSPLETWQEREVDEYSLVEITPRLIGFKLGFKEKKRFYFKIQATQTGKFPSFWAIAKLAYLGKVEYRLVK